MISSTRHATDLHPETVHAAVRALFLAAGDPVRSGYQPMSDYPSEGRAPFRPGAIDGGVHPVFGLLSHFRAHDDGAPGFTKNPWRGDHMSVPCWSEHGDPFVLETSFHKGDAFVERVDFPTAPAGILDALTDLLQSCETR